MANEVMVKDVELKEDLSLIADLPMPLLTKGVQQQQCAPVKQPEITS